MDFLRSNKLVFHLLVGLILAAVYPMQALFSGNQNIYFLWGMAEMLPNTFAADPLLLSPDPYPIFTWLISLFPIQWLTVWTSLIYVLLNAVYSFSLFGIADHFTSLYKREKQLFSFTAIFIFLHSSPVWGTYLKLIADMDLRWIWDSGIAEQGVLRGYLQPSVFGVFLLLGFYQAIKRNWFFAILSLAPAAMMHANYLFLGGLLTAIYLIQARFEKKSLLASLILLASVLPYSVYLLNHFVLLDESLKSSINDAVMAGFVENLHINPSNWLNAKFYLQLVALSLGGLMIWTSTLKRTFFGILVTAVGLSVVAYVLNSTTLISLNPWRLSIILIPISITVILSRIVASGLWESIRPFVFGCFASIGVALIHYRIMGNSSQEFLVQWWSIHSMSFIVFSVGCFLLSKKDVLSKIIEPAMVFGLIAIGVIDLYIEEISRDNSHQFQVIKEVRATEEPNTVYIIPPEWTSFRMNARKAVFVDGNLVYGPGLPSLMTRLDLATEAYESGDFGPVLDQIPNEFSVVLISGERGANEKGKSSAYKTEALR